MVPVQVSHLVSLDGEQGWLLGLLDQAGQRVLPIQIGSAEAFAIAAGVQERPPARPSTHDLMLAVIGRLGGSIERVIVHDLHEDTFISQLDIATPAGVQEVDCRPSDAVALAVRARCAILVDEDVLEQAAVPLGQDGSAGVIDED